MDSLINTLGARNGYHRIQALCDCPPFAFAAAGNVRSWIETLKYLKSKGPQLHRFFAFHLNRFFPSLFESEGDAGEGLTFDVSLMTEEEQFRLLKQNPESDLPVFVFKFVCDRGITHEVVRHRVFSFTQESTRYVNYKNKGMTLILPEELYPFFDETTGECRTDEEPVRKWLARATALFDWYREDLARGLKPQIARDILPNLLKSEIFVSGRWSGWKHFVHLRDSSAAHPRIRFIAQLVRSHFESIGMAFD
jgi:flavin-dependent thymidylate synthase